MFTKKTKTNFLLILLTLLIIPINVFAYSDYIIAGGQNIGIELNSKSVIIVGTYKVDNNDPAKDDALRTGDKILKVNNLSISSIDEMLNIIDKFKDDSQINITYERANSIYNTTLKLTLDSDNILKTGLYVKDSITGVGTLTFIDPNTKFYGALGHEIIESTSRQKLEIKEGKIYNSIVTGITPSNNGHPGEKNARYDTSDVYGNVTENSSSGIFGKYSKEVSGEKLFKVASSDEIKEGEAKILTVITGNVVEEFEINILKINHNSNSTKNLLFEITDKSLLTATGGIVQGMSGSPIIQDDKIIGAVTHVVVDDPTKGYGIFITTMLEEAEN